MSTGDPASSRGLLPVLLRGTVAGATSAIANSLYLALHLAVTKKELQVPTFFSVAASSLLPTVLAALGYFVLDRVTRRAPIIFVALTTAITLASFEGAFHSTLPDGTPKPPGFDLLVLPMHAVVGAAAALLIPGFGWRACGRTA
jgi:hypothetical protein